MAIKAFKNYFTSSKPKDKKVKHENRGTEDGSDVMIAEIQEDAIKKPAAATAGQPPIPLADGSVRPHGPVAELTIDPEDTVETEVIKEDEIKIAPLNPEKGAKPHAAAAEKAPASMAAAKPEVKPEEKKESKPAENDSLNSLFSNDEVTDNPLDSLIKSLPDVTTGEIMDDLSEIQRIIKEWRIASK
jgi:hypothetical protein